ncbi:MAG: glycosyltransferase family 9 protein [Pirellulaceae bacterium]|jgi:lipopolysaccharide heptosyltransferase I|nr:glycosyltransferase family 9 protein [Pirellulaceae bacterium]
MNDTDLGPRILITRLSAVGDCILTLPLVCALREHFPSAYVIWAVEPVSASLLSRHPAVDRLLVVPRRWLASPHVIRVLRDRLRGLQVDVVLDPQSLTKSSLLGWFSGARRRIGFARPQGRELAPWVNNEHVVRGGAHIVDATLKLLAPLGVTDPAPRFGIPRLADAEATIDAFVRDAHLTGGYAVINSAASWTSKQWPADRFGRVARHLGEDHDLPTVVTWGGPREAGIAAQIVAKGGGHAVLAPRTSLPQLAALLRRARLMLAADTGPLHLAAGLGVTCVGLYGPTRVENSGPYGPDHVAIQAADSHALSRRQRRLDDSAMRQITVEQVCAAADTILCRRAGRQPHAA